jgi:hypothetical protein
MLLVDRVAYVVDNDRVSPRRQRVQRSYHGDRWLVGGR